MNHCGYDSESPYLREWALFAVRNLCADNMDNQQAVEALKPQEAIADEALRSAGIEPVLVEQDKREGGRPSIQLRKVSQASQK